MAASAEEVAAVAVRVGALSGALDQLRLSLLAALDRTSERLDQPAWLPDVLAALGPRPEGAVVDELSGRLAAIELATGQLAGEARLLGERVGPLPDRLGAIAAQVDRITPLARSVDDAGSLLAQLNRVNAGLDRVVLQLGNDAVGPGTVSPRDSSTDDARFEAIIDALAGLTRRQDEVTAAISSVLDQVQGPMGVVSVLDRMEQRERSVAARLDRIDAGLRERSGQPTGSGVEAVRRTDVDGNGDGALTVVLEAVERQEQALTARLDRLDADLHAVDERTGPAAPESPAVPVPDAVPVLKAVLQRLDQQERTMAGHLEGVSDRLAEVAVHLIPVPPADTPATTPSSGTDERLDAVIEALAGLARRQDQLTANLAILVAQIPPPPDPSASAIAASRLDELRAERARIQIRLREERVLAAQDWGDDAADGSDDDEDGPWA